VNERSAAIANAEVAVLTVCQMGGCGEAAAVRIWGDLSPLRGCFCWDHARGMLGCLCRSCEEQSAWERIL